MKRLNFHNEVTDEYLYRQVAAFSFKDREWDKFTRYIETDGYSVSIHYRVGK